MFIRGRIFPFWLPASGFCILPRCSTSLRRKFRQPPTSSSTCGGFFDVPGAQKRLGETRELMAADNFWNNREQAQKLIDEANSLRKKSSRSLKAEKQLEDFRDGGTWRRRTRRKPGAGRIGPGRATWGRFQGTGRLELKVFLNGPHDKNNCILSINAGAGGTESCDWANMLLRMYQRWVESRGWEVEVTDALPGERRGHQERHAADHRRERLRLLQGRARRTPAGAHFAVRFQQTPAHEFCQRGRDCGNRGKRSRRSSFRRMNFTWTRFVPAARAGRT
jgi:hypothetical protein